MQVGDYIIQPYAHHEANIWRVTGVYLGGLGHQDMVGLIPINRKLGCDGERSIEEMLCPLELAEPFLVEKFHG